MHVIISPETTSSNLRRFAKTPPGMRTAAPPVRRGVPAEGSDVANGVPKSGRMKLIESRTGFKGFAKFVNMFFWNLLDVFGGWLTV